MKYSLSYISSTYDMLVSKHCRRYHRHYRHRNVRAATVLLYLIYVSIGRFLSFSVYMSRLLRAGAQTTELKGRYAEANYYSITLPA